MEKERKKCVRRKTNYNGKAELPRQQVQGTRNSERSATLNLEEEGEKELKDFCNLTENEKKGINNFLSKDLYEKELKFKRQTAEVECITDGVKTIVKQLTAAVGDKEPLLEISHQYLVGSMAEGTSIEEPDEFDFLVVLRHFSEPGAISINEVERGHHVCNENIDLSSRKSDYVCFNVDRTVKFEDDFMTTILQNFISSIPEPLYAETDHGRLTLNSTTVCDHGPASVVKLIWTPKSESSTPLDILIDITSCIEQKGIDKVIGSRGIPLHDGYKSQILNDDTFMLIPTSSMRRNYDPKYTLFDSAITTTEVKIVKTLSSHHKTSYMILKYCFNSIIHKHDSYWYSTLLPSYLIKMFLLRHVLRCQSPEKGHHDTEKCGFTCLFDLTRDLKKNCSKGFVDGIFGAFEMPFGLSILDYSTKVIDNVIGRLVQIGKKKYSVCRHENFRMACHRTYTHPAIQKRANKLARNNVECHLSHSCKMHEEYDI